MKKQTFFRLSPIFVSLSMLFSMANVYAEDHAPAFGMTEDDAGPAVRVRNGQLGTAKCVETVASAGIGGPSDKVCGLNGWGIYVSDLKKISKITSLETDVNKNKANISDLSGSLGGGAGVGGDGRVTPPTYIIVDAKTGETKELHTVGDAIDVLQSNIGANAEDDAKHLGGGATVGADGRVTAPTYSILDTATGTTKDHHNVGDAISALDSNTQTLASDVAKHLGGGSVVGADGRVTSPTYTIINAGNGETVNHTNVGSAILAVQSNVNFNAQDDAKHLGGGASVGEDGRVIAPTYTIMDAATGTAIGHRDVGSAINALDSNINVAAHDLAKILGSGASVGEDGRVIAPTYEMKDLSSGKMVKYNDLGSVIGNINKNISYARNEGFAGTATALAATTLGQSFKPGQSSFGIGSAVYKGRVGYAIGGSHLSESGKFLLKGNVTTNNYGHVGAAVGATWYFD